MGQKHNRRRTRPRSQNRVNPLSTGPYIDLTAFDPQYPYRSSTPQPQYNYGIPSIPSSSSPAMVTPQQPRGRRQHTDMRSLEAEQYRLFGGEPGDDVGLCYRMLEYFGGLDYIDT